MNKKNLKKLLELVERTPAEKFDLGVFSCFDTYCGIGLYAKEYPDSLIGIHQQSEPHSKFSTYFEAARCEFRIGSFRCLEVFAPTQRLVGKPAKDHLIKTITKVLNRPWHLRFLDWF